MMSAELSVKKSRPFWQMFGFTLFKNKALIIISSIIAFLFTQGITVNTNVSSFGAGGADYRDLRILVNLQSGLRILWCISTLLIAVLIAINLRYMHRKKSSDMFFALPITARKLFGARFLASFTGAIIPAVIGHITIATFALIHCSYTPMLNTFLLGILINLGTIIMAMFVFAGLAAGFMLFTGHTYDAVQAFLIVSFLPCMLFLLMRNDMFNSLYGYYGFASASVLNDDFCLSLSPFISIMFLALDTTVFSFSDTKLSYAGYIDITGPIVWLGIAVFVLIFCLWFVPKRRNEMAGESYINSVLPNILQFLTSVSVAMIFALMFGDFTSLFYTAAAVVFALLGSIIFGAIRKRGFKKLKNDIIIGTVSSIIVIILSAIFITGIGFENTVPAVEDIENVTVQIYEIPFLTEFDEAEDIERVITLHNEFVTKKPGRSYDLVNGKTLQGEYTPIIIRYTLKNGKTLERKYDSGLADSAYFVNKVLESENSMEAYILRPDTGDMTQCKINVDYSTATVPFEKVDEIVKTYKKEIKEGKRHFNNLSSEEKIHFSCYDVKFYDKKTQLHRGGLTFNVPLTCTETVDLINECLEG